MTALANIFESGLEEIRRSWIWFLIIGIILMVLGVSCITLSQTATTFSVLVLGWVLAISGVVWLLGAFEARIWGGFFLYILNAVIRCITGYLLIRHPDAGAAAITMVLAVLFIVAGLFRVIGASVVQFPRWGWTFVAGLVSVFLGVYLLFTFPAATSFFLGLAIGIDLVFDGAALAGFAGAIHSLPTAHPKAV